MHNLADLTPQRASSRERTAPPVPAVDTSLAPNAVCELRLCTKCRTEQVLVVIFGRWHDPASICDSCKRAEALEREARTLLATPERQAEIACRVERRLAETAPERDRRADDEVQKLIEFKRPEIAERLRWEDSQRYSSDAEAEELARLIGELKAKAS